MWKLFCVISNYFFVCKSFFGFFCRPKTPASLALKLVFVQASVADEMNWGTTEWNIEGNLKALYFDYKDQVSMHDIELKEGEDLFGLLKNELLDELNVEKTAEGEAEVILSGDGLCFLSLPAKWTNLKFVDVVNLEISKPAFKKRVVVIKTQNPCK